MKKIALTCNLLHQAIEKDHVQEYDLVTYPLFLLTIDQLDKELKMLLHYYLNQEATQLDIYVHQYMKTSVEEFCDSILKIIPTITSNHPCDASIFVVHEGTQARELIREKTFNESTQKQNKENQVA